MSELLDELESAFGAHRLAHERAAVAVESWERAIAAVRHALNTSRITRSVLVVDDDAAFARHTADLIARRCDVPVYVETSASQALARWCAERCAVVVLDLDLGADSDSGLEVATRIGRGPRIVLYSGHRDLPDLEEAAANLGATLVPKADGSEIVLAVSTHLSAVGPTDRSLAMARSIADAAREPTTILVAIRDEHHRVTDLRWVHCNASALTETHSRVGVTLGDLVGDPRQYPWWTHFVRALEYRSRYEGHIPHDGKVWHARIVPLGFDYVLMSAVEVMA